VLRSIELNLNPLGEGGLDQQSLRPLDLVLGCFHSSLEKRGSNQRYVAALQNPDIQILGHPKGAFSISVKVLKPIGNEFLTPLQNSTKLLRSQSWAVAVRSTAKTKRFKLRNNNLFAS
jgi:histidinol phosphatase-like PHP family hydrolase